MPQSKDLRAGCRRILQYECAFEWVICITNAYTLAQGSRAESGDRAWHSPGIMKNPISIDHHHNTVCINIIIKMASEPIYGVVKENR